MFSPLKNSVYARLFSAQVIALLGTGLTTVALALLAFELAGGDAGKVLGTALAIKMIAYVFFSPIAGSIAQKLPRRQFLVSLDVIRALFVACLPFVTQVWQIYVLIFLMQICSAGFTPAFQATSPDILKAEGEYTKALALSRLAYDLESLASPALAAMALLFVSFNGLFAFNAIAFVISAILIISTILPRQSPAPEADGIFSRISFGIRAYLATPRLRGLLAMSMAGAAAGSMVIVNTVVYVQSALQLGQQETAIMLAAFGFGSICSAVSLPKLLKIVDDRTVMILGGLVMAAALFIGIFRPGYAAALTVWAVIGIGFTAVSLPSGRLLTRSSNPADRPAYFSAHFALSHACWLITYPLAGWVGSSMGLPVAFALLLAIVVCSILVAWIIWPATDQTVMEHSHEAVDHAHMHVHDEHHQHEHEGWEGPEPHSHPHRHEAVRHRHAYVIDFHHPRWP
ncbi:MAG: MFS transporter [Pseudomonadota bacterium]